MKMTAYLMALMLVVAVGTVAAASNGITDFSGASYDRGDIGLALVPMNSMSGVSAGGLRVEGSELYNGITDFIGGTNPDFDIAKLLKKSNRAAGESAGGMRVNVPAAHNGITDFNGASLDRGEIGY